MKRTAPLLAALCVLGLARALPADENGKCFFREGDRIVFLGDSIAKP